MADSKATKAAAEKAEEAGIDVATVEPSGKDGTVVKADVEKAESAPDTHVKVKFNPELLLTAAEVEGSHYEEGDVVTEDYFDSVLTSAKDSDGRKVFVKGEEVALNG